MSKISETIMQAILMRWAMGNNHIYAVPNSTVIYPWESDLISVTKALYAHEYEIKISMADYKKDAEKKWKHLSLQLGDLRNTPNYFWYATYEFDIEPPDHAGWIKVNYDERRFNYHVEIRKDAPRLCTQKVSEAKTAQIAKLLSWRLANIYHGYIHDSEDMPVIQGEVMA